MKISFIIASVDRDKELQHCIASIEEAHEHNPSIPIEILVIIQGAKQKKKILLRSPEITFFYYIDNMGLSVARNFAIDRSKGDYLVFIDDDASIKEDFLDILTKKTTEYNKINAFCGRILDTVGSVPFSPIFRNTIIKSLKRNDYQYFMGSAHVLSKGVFRKIGCYDERFGAGAKYYGSEESDMFFRLKHHGEKVIYLPELVFYHPINSSISELKCFNYSFAVGAMLTKQMFLDIKCLHSYLFIISIIVFKSSLRTVQTIFFPKSIESKNARYRYKTVLKGILMGVCNYISNPGIKMEK